MECVLITGGTSDLGREIAKVFAKNGYSIILGYKTKKDLAMSICKKITCKYNVQCTVKYVNIIDEDCVKNVFENNIDILINNAALCMDNYIEDKSFNEFLEVINTNIGGTFLMCKYANNVKTIINISSRDGIDTFNPISLDYCASKSAIINLTKNLSLYYKDKRFLCICPGWIDTESVKSMNPNFLKEEMKRVNQKELLNKSYVAERIYDIYNSNIDSGSVIVIDEKK